jgi:hypothetical protein
MYEALSLLGVQSCIFSAEPRDCYHPLHHLTFDRPPGFFSFPRQFNTKDETIFSYVSNLDGGATWAGR